MKAYLKPLSFVYHQIVGMKNSLYDRGFIGVYKAPCPVISIGNLTVGGTGKTPLTDFCLKNLVASGKRVAVISRSYRAQAKAPCLVDPRRPSAAAYYGDEPVLLAKSNPQVSVFVGPSKWQTARYACSEAAFDLLIVDDGYQHRRLHRDLNIVILDATEVLSNYEVLPEGRARESWRGLQRADVILITKCNLSTQEDLKLLEQRLPSDKEILYFGYDISKFRNMFDERVLAREALKGKSSFLVSAIARSDVFEKMMRELGEVSKSSIHYRDHHPYSQQDADMVYDEFKRSNCDYLVTTEKDAVKLRGIFPHPEQMWGAVLEIQEIGHKGRLNEIIGKILS